MENNKTNGPEVLQNHDGDCWFRADEYKFEEYTEEQINECGQEFGGTGYKYKLDKKVYMRPNTDEENDQIGEEGWWSDCKESDPEAVAYWKLESEDE